MAELNSTDIHPETDNFHYIFHNAFNSILIAYQNFFEFTTQVQISCFFIIFRILKIRTQLTLLFISLASFCLQLHSMFSLYQFFYSFTPRFKSQRKTSFIYF
jgi:hypothetical protein